LPRREKLAREQQVMAKSSKDSKNRGRTPAWASFFTPGQHAEFVQLVASGLAKRGLRAHLDEGSAIVRREGQPDQRMGLVNLAQMCLETDRSKWPSVIDQFLDSMAKTRTDPEGLLRQLADYEAMKTKIKVRLHGDDYLKHPHAALLCLRELVPGIAQMLVCDLGHANVSLPAEFPRKWGRSLDELFALGVENVKAEPPLHAAKGAPSGGNAVDMLTSDSNYAATHALFFERYLEKGTGYGALVGVPNRHVLFRHVLRDRSVAEAMAFLIEAIRDQFRKGPGAISQQLYWWRGGELRVVPTLLKGSELVVAPGEEFQRVVLEPMMKGN
jgi:hypothetical protein